MSRRADGRRGNDKQIHTNDMKHAGNTVIAIDGPAASGKSTVSRRLAADLGYAHVDTGSMYRALTWRLLELGIDTSDREQVAEALPRIRIETEIGGGHLVQRLDGLDPAPFIKEDRVSAAVSDVASVPEVRELLVGLQRGLLEHGSLVMEGRDIGSKVFPETPHKFYIDADPEVRARRRAAEGSVEEISRRDRQDSTRKASPLKTAEDAIVIDSTHMSIEEVVEEVLRHLPDLGTGQG